MFLLATERSEVRVFDPPFHDARPAGFRQCPPHGVAFGGAVPGGLFISRAE
jgi:hypothetical protein